MGRETKFDVEVRETVDAGRVRHSEMGETLRFPSVRHRDALIKANDLDCKDTDQALKNTQKFLNTTEGRRYRTYKRKYVNGFRLTKK